MKKIRLVTVKYDHDLDGFPEKPLLSAQAEGTLIECREYYYELNHIPRITFVLVLETDPGPKNRNRKNLPSTDPWHKLPEQRRALYKILKEWRRTISEEKGLPVFTILRNHQLADICMAAPKSLSELRSIPGIGEATVKKYGNDILAFIPENMSEWTEDIPEDSDPSIEDTTL
jgi:superfamily II DNA helicase RecQ